MLKTFFKIKLLISIIITPPSNKRTHLPPLSGETPAYHYGTHYSSAMIVASYLVRMEPFTQIFLRLQVSLCTCCHNIVIIFIEGK